MKRYFLLIILASVLAPMAGAQDENPGSLWSDQAQNPLLDRTARREGDLITVLVSESSTASFSAKTDASKADNSSVPAPSVPFLWRILRGWLIQSDSSNSGSGSTTNTGQFTAKLTGIVKKVLPNGTMVIEATKAIKVNKETQVFRLSGVIRRDDISPENTIKSELIAEADIQLDGKGMIADRQRRGILTRLLDWLF